MKEQLIKTLTTSQINKACKNLGFKRSEYDGKSKRHVQGILLTKSYSQIKQALQTPKA